MHETDEAGGLGMRLLQEGIPITLLIDLFGGPLHSPEIYRAEPADAGWVHRAA